MQYMQWQGLARSDRPWLLKSPAYGSQELEILDVFPDARFVMAHRSPLSTVPSTCTLVGHFRRAYGTSTPDPMLLMEHAAASMDAQSEIRRAHRDLPLLDLRFDDIVGDLGTVVERVYGHAGMTLNDESRDRMRRWDEENAMHRLGTFEYSLAEIGLGGAVIRERMRTYFALLDRLEQARPTDG
jgi:hypothetical protein